MANRTGGQILVSMFGKNLTTKEVDIYQNLITTGEPVSFSTDPMSSGSYDWITVRDRAGKIIGQVQGDETDPAGELSFSFYEDYDYVNDDYVYGNSKNMLLNMFNGEAFKNGADVVVPIGTNGTDKSLTALAKARDMNQPYKYLLHNEGAFIKEVGTANVADGGRVTFKKNPFQDSFNMTHKTVCMEFLSATGQGQTCKMFPIVAKSTAEWAEGDINQFNLTAQRGCDFWERNDFWTEVYREDVDTTRDILELYVKAIVVEGEVEPTGANGEYVAVVDVDGNLTVKKHNGTTWAEATEVVAKFKTGTRIKSNKLISMGGEEEVNCFVALDADKKLVRFSTDPTVKKFYAKVMDFSREEAKYIPYVTVA